MKVVILAAGIGSRLGLGDLPKPLTCLGNGKAILQMQLETIERFLSLDDVLLVVGHHKEELMDLFPNLLYVYNPNYSHENTSKSLLRALNKIDDDLIWINGDVVFHPSVFEKIHHSPSSAMITNHSEVGEEEVKFRSDSRGRIIEISKSVVDGEGEALGINFFMRQHLPYLREGLEKCQAVDYFEKGVEWAISRGVEVHSIGVEKELCIEIDFPEDLLIASDLVSRWH